MLNREYILRNVVSGLEGCGKSSKVFSSLKDIVTTEEPLLIGVKNYKLMQEQLSNWSNRFSIPIEQFAICGFNLDYEPAREAYTDKETPFVINEKVKYVFTSQAIIQRNQHLKLRRQNNKPISFKHIIIDEFDFTSGIIPSLDYELSSMKEDEIKQRTIKQKLDWILRNYTFEDRVTASIKKHQHDKSFSLAYWIESSVAPITFLTSELLATRLLKLLGFNEINIIGAEFKDCIVNTWSSELIGRNFFNKMNQYVGWNKLEYDLIISDCINSYFEDNNTNLEIAVINHTSIRGSNDWINKKILTVLSHIPKQVLTTIQDTFNCFGESIEYREVEALFYRDRLCQAIGRVIGNRGGKETDLIVHSQILQKIKDYNLLDVIVPYTLNNNWIFTFNGFDKILEKVKEVEKVRKECKSKRYINNKIHTYTLLDNYFVKDEDSIIPISKVKEYMIKNNITGINGTGTLPVTKVAEYFGAKITNIKPNGRNSKSVRVVKGINFI